MTASATTRNRLTFTHVQLAGAIVGAVFLLVGAFSASCPGSPPTPAT